MLLTSPPDNKSLGDVPLDDVPVGDVLLRDVPLEDVPLDDVPLCDVPIDDAPLDNVPLCDVPLDDVPRSDVPLGGVLLDDVPIDDVVGNSIICLRAFLMAACLVNEFLREKVFISSCHNSIIKSIMQGNNKNFTPNLLPAIL